VTVTEVILKSLSESPLIVEAVESQLGLRSAVSTSAAGSGLARKVRNVSKEPEQGKFGVAVTCIFTLISREGGASRQAEAKLDAIQEI
jgi:hypothetical protein